MQPSAVPSERTRPQTIPTHAGEEQSCIKMVTHPQACSNIVIIRCRWDQEVDLGQKVDRNKMNDE